MRLSHVALVLGIAGAVIMLAAGDSWLGLGAAVVLFIAATALAWLETYREKPRAHQR